MTTDSKSATPAAGAAPRAFEPIVPAADQVPPELLPLKRWLCWQARWDEKQERWLKIPHSPLTGLPAGAAGEKWEPHWTDFEAARAGCVRHGLSGVGFVFAEGDGFTGTDFDKCRDPQTGAVHPVAAAWVAHLGTYAEVSPSGTGLHAIARASLPGPGNKQPLPEDPSVKVEMYDDARFFTFTGQRLEGSPLEIRGAQPEINALHAHAIARADLRPAGPGPGPEPFLAREFMSDEQAEKRIRAHKKWADIFDKAKDAKPFVAEHYKGDDSAADFAFCALAARYTMNPGQVERLWRRSRLWRQKSERPDYLLSTVNKAMAARAKEHGELVDTADRAEVEWLWPGRFPRGKLVMLDGDPGLGKSMFSLAAAVSVMTGKPFLDGARPEATGGVVLLSAEDDLRDTIVPRLVAAGAPDGRRIPLVHVPSTKPDGAQFSLASADDRLELEILAARVAAQLIVIDPLNAYLGDKVDSHNDQKIRQVLAPLSEIANRTGAVVLCLRHLPKTAAPKAIYRGMGSIGYTAAARANFLVAEHPAEKDAFVMAASKFNLGPKPASIMYRLAFAQVPGIAKPVPYVANGTECDLTADELVGIEADEAEGGNKVSAAAAFLRKTLASGAVLVSRAAKAADKEGISARTLRRARELLKVESVRRGEECYWALEKHAAAFRAQGKTAKGAAGQQQQQQQLALEPKAGGDDPEQGHKPVKAKDDVPL